MVIEIKFLRLILNYIDIFTDTIINPWRKREDYIELTKTQFIRKTRNVLFIDYLNKSFLFAIYFVCGYK